MEQQLLPPGFRFSPTDEELVASYLRPKVVGRNYHQGTIAEVDVYKFEPWDLPGKSALPSKDQEWYFFSAQDRKYSHTARINRTTQKGYWKATGKDRKVYSVSSVIGLKKTLIYYEGRAPNGSRTNWIMHEYRLDEEFERREEIVCGAVLCRIRKKSGLGPRNGEQYGAPVLNESGELEEEANTGKVDDSSERSSWEVESKCGGNAYNLQDQVEVWKWHRQMGSSNVPLAHPGTGSEKSGYTKIASDCRNVPDRKETLECDPGLELFQSIFDMAPCIHECDGIANLSPFSDLEKLPLLPTCLDIDGQLLYDYKYSDFDEYKMLREMSDLVNNDKGEVLLGKGFHENSAIQDSCNIPLGGDYIELDDMMTPLDWYAHGVHIKSIDLGEVENEQLSDAKLQSFEEIQGLLHAQRSAACRDWLQSPAAAGRVNAAHTLFPQVDSGFHGGRSEEMYRNASNHNLDSSFGEYNTSHLVESSTRNYLAKQMSTYAVSRHEMAPAKLCYAASFTDRQDHAPAKRATALTIKSKCDIDVDGFRILPVSPIDTPSAPTLVIKTSSNIDADALEKSSATPTSPSSDLPSKTSSSEGSSVDVEALVASQPCDSEAESVNMSFSHRHRWKRPLRRLVSKVKQSGLGTRIVELESGMRAKFNDKLSALGKSAARVIPPECDANTYDIPPECDAAPYDTPTECDASPYDNLKKLLVATLCRLVAAVLISLCLFWGSRMLVSYASSVPV